ACAPSTARRGSVDRCGFLYVNCNPSCSPASLRRSSSVRARCSTSASQTPTCEISCCSAISTNRRRYAASTEGGDSVGLTVTQRRHHSRADQQTHHPHLLVVEVDRFRRRRFGRCR